MMEEQAYAYIEEANHKELMEILDAVVNRFREVMWEEELMIITVSRTDPEKRRIALRNIVDFIQKHEIDE